MIRKGETSNEAGKMGEKGGDAGKQINNETDGRNDNKWKMVKSSKGQFLEAIGGKDREATYATQKEKVLTQNKAETERKKLMQKGGNEVDRPIMGYGTSYLGSNEEKMYQIKVEKSNSGMRWRPICKTFKGIHGPPNSASRRNRI